MFILCIFSRLCAAGTRLAVPRVQDPQGTGAEETADTGSMCAPGGVGGPVICVLQERHPDSLRTLLCLWGLPEHTAHPLLSLHLKCDSALSTFLHPSLVNLRRGRRNSLTQPAPQTFRPPALIFNRGQPTLPGALGHLLASQGVPVCVQLLQKQQGPRPRAPGLHLLPCCRAEEFLLTPVL